MIQQRVAFDFHSADFQRYAKEWDKKTVKDYIHHLLEDGQHIRDVIDSKVKKKKGQEHAIYIICWEYCTKGINNIRISVQESFAVTHLSKQLERNKSSGKIAEYDIKEKPTRMTSTLQYINSYTMMLRAIQLKVRMTYLMMIVQEDYTKETVHIIHPNKQRKTVHLKQAV